MAQGRNGMSRNTMLIVSAVVGVLVLLGFWALAAYGFFGALVLGMIVGIVVYLILFYGFGQPVEAETPHPAEPVAHETGEDEAEHILHSPSDEEYDEDYEDGALDSTGAGTGLNAMAEAPADWSEKPAAAETPSEAPAAESPAEEPVAPAAPAPKPAPKPAVVEGEGTKPAALDKPREGGADDLKEIKGVGPKLEELLNEHGIYHFDQIAGWGPAEVAWMDSNLKGFRGRVSRDDWVDQARILASGGDTEFSSRVDKGEVY